MSSNEILRSTSFSRGPLRFPESAAPPRLQHDINREVCIQLLFCSTFSLYSNCLSILVLKQFLIATCINNKTCQARVSNAHEFISHLTCLCVYAIRFYECSGLHAAQFEILRSTPLCCVSQRFASLPGCRTIVLDGRMTLYNVVRLLFIYGLTSFKTRGQENKRIDFV